MNIIEKIAHAHKFKTSRASKIAVMAGVSPQLGQAFCNLYASSSGAFSNFAGYTPRTSLLGLAVPMVESGFPFIAAALIPIAGYLVNADSHATSLLSNAVFFGGAILNGATVFSPRFAALFRRGPSAEAMERELTRVLQTGGVGPEAIDQAVAYTRGGKWLVMDSAASRVQLLDQAQYTAWRQAVDASGRLLSEVTSQGTTMTLKRTVGGVLQGPSAEDPAVIQVFRDGSVTDTFMENGRKTGEEHMTRQEVVALLAEMEAAHDGQASAPMPMPDGAAPAL
jgi:hypothetical protein